MKRRLTVMLFALLMSTVAQAQDRAWDLGITLGAGQRSNPLRNGEDIDLWWSLNFAWFGERFFFDNGDLGFTLHDGPNATLNWVARLNTERAFFSELNEGLFNRTVFVSEGDAPGVDGALSEDAAPISIPDRDYAFETGLEYLLDQPWGRLHAQAMADVSGVHQGFDVWLSVSDDFILGRWHLVPSATINWKSRKLNDYYYGIRASEAQGSLTEYQAGEGINVAVKLSASYYISSRWRFMMTMDYESINTEAADSPLLEDDYIASYFMGVHYAF